MSPGADYAQPQATGNNQIYGTPLTQSSRSVCYDQRTYQDRIVEGEEFILLLVATERRTLPNVVIDGAFDAAVIGIQDDDVGKLLYS